MKPTYVIEEMLSALGDDPQRPGLRATPARVVKSWQTLFSGYDRDPSAILERTFPQEGHEYGGMVVLNSIKFFSMCEHHVLPFFGHCAVGYLPKDRLVGVSKLARLVDCFARRLQVQERLTDQIADAIEQHLDPLGCAVLMKAQHMCMLARGVEQDRTEMVTSALRGQLKDPEVRAEFLTLADF